MIQISKEDKEKVIKAIYSGTIDTAELALPTLAMTAKHMGFISREITNYLKTERKVDTYIPARENMDIFKNAVPLAVPTGKWQKHPNKKEKTKKYFLQRTMKIYSSSRKRRQL